VAETVEQRYDRLSKEMAKFEEMVPDVERDEPDASMSDKMKRRYINVTAMRLSTLGISILDIRVY